MADLSPSHDPLLRLADEHVSVEVQDVSVQFGCGRVLEHVSFGCAPGEWTLLTGPSGVGKSTLLRVINGLCAPSSGRVRVLGTWLPGRKSRQARAVWRQTGTVLQDVALFETRSVRANVELSLRATGVQRAIARDRAFEWLERLGLEEKVDEYPWQLSGGQRQRVALARALAPHPKMLILDEPTSALDRATAANVLGAIEELRREGTTVIMSSHREDEMAGRCDQWIALKARESVGEHDVAEATAAGVA